MDTSIHVRPVRVPSKTQHLLFPTSESPSPHDSIPRRPTMNKNLTSAQTTSVIGAVLALLALIVFLVTRSRREI